MTTPARITNAINAALGGRLSSADLDRVQRAVAEEVRPVLEQAKRSYGLIEDVVEFYWYGRMDDTSTDDYDLYRALRSYLDEYGQEAR